MKTAIFSMRLLLHEITYFYTKFSRGGYPFGFWDLLLIRERGNSYKQSVWKLDSRQATIHFGCNEMFKATREISLVALENAYYWFTKEKSRNKMTIIILISATALLDDLKNLDELLRFYPLRRYKVAEFLESSVYNLQKSITQSKNESDKYPRLINQYAMNLAVSIWMLVNKILAEKDIALGHLLYYHASQNCRKVLQ
ncbi:hypothetical protein BD560DRAFT_472872 [Blakeslea trispora]|nr:hypothetical protein BD560DRAFT_472872 [Blakeslea trispora]